MRVANVLAKSTLSSWAPAPGFQSLAVLFVVQPLTQFLKLLRISLSHEAVLL